MAEASIEQLVGMHERRSPRVEFAPVHLVCCGLAAVIVWLISTLLLYLTADYEVQFIKRQVMGVRICGLLVLLTLVVLFIFPYKTQSLFVNILRGLATIFAVSWGMFIDEHALIRWLYVISTIAVSVIDALCVALQADLLDCQVERRCHTGDPTWMLMTSYLRQYIAISLQLLGLLYSLYLFHGLGFFQTILLPDEYGVPRHLRELAKASITRKKLEARDPTLFDKGNVRQLFDPKDPLEIKWDAFTDSLLGENRKSWPISRNRRRASNVSPSELQRRLHIMQKLHLPIDDYLEMRREQENDGHM